MFSEKYYTIEIIVAFIFFKMSALLINQHNLTFNSMPEYFQNFSNISIPFTLSKTVLLIRSKLVCFHFFRL